MKQNLHHSSLKSLILFLTILLFSFSEIQSQKKNNKVSDSIQVVDDAISISSISDESEKLGRHIKELREILKPSSEISLVDSLLKVTASEFKNKKDSLLPELYKMTRRNLKATKVKWKSYRSNLKDYQNTLNSRIEEIGDINDDLIKELDKWEHTKKKLTNNKSSDVYDNLDEAIISLQEVIKTAHSRLDSVFTVQKGLIGLVLAVDETLSEIERIEHQMQKDYFVFDSKPLWKQQEVKTNITDTTKVEQIHISKKISSALKKNKENLKEFISSNTETAITQIIFLILLFVFLIIVNRRWGKGETSLNHPIESQTKIILAHPLSTTIVVGLLISAFFYNTLIPSLGEMHVFLVLIATVFLLPKLTNKKFGIFLLLLFIAYIIQTSQTYLGLETTTDRWLTIINSLILIIALIIGKRIVKANPSQFGQLFRLFMIMSTLYITILIISIFVNIIGMVALSKMLFKGILLSTILGMVVYLSVIVVTSIFVLFFQLKKSHSIQTLDTMITVTHQRVRPLLIWIGLFIWIIFTLKGFDLYENIVSWISNLMHIKWEVGETIISFGGILSFLGIFIITLILAKMVATIFKDDWMVKILPRGVAPAVSLTLRIFVVGIGFYLAASAAGIDLSKLGFIVGALGVGIGFGLQNIVLNFISGLILAFERPINIGDTIEVDQEMGVVTNIGVRSSNVRSYSGYESIIPNGDLISKKVINHTLSDRNRRSKILMKTAPNADPEKVIELFNKIASENQLTYSDPAPKTYFYGYDPDGSLSFALMYWTTFSDTLKTDSAIALNIYKALKENGIQAPAPVRHIISGK